MRVASVPPDVYEPASHSSHAGALLMLHMLSAPHGSQPRSVRYSPARQNVHCVAPASEDLPGGQTAHSDAPSASENVPAAHGTLTFVPLHAEPAGHLMQLMRVVEVPPVV